MKRCAAFLGCSVEHFRKAKRRQPGVPQPIDQPGHPRWLPNAWPDWARANEVKEAA